jgi:hypothetical protein
LTILPQGPTFANNYGGEELMIKRFAGTTPTRSRAVAYGVVYAVATAKNKAVGLYEQTKDALAQIDSTLAEAGSDKSRILRATVYITDMQAGHGSRVGRVGRSRQPAAAGLHWRSTGRQGSGRNPGHSRTAVRASSA